MVRFIILAALKMIETKIRQQHFRRDDEGHIQEQLKSTEG